MPARSCPQCGAEVDLPPERLADRCTFCETPLVAQVHEAEAPDLVVPFRVTREVAIRRAGDRLAAAWRAPARWQPSVAAAEVRGALVPFYAYDGVARSRWRARVALPTDGRSPASWHDLEGTHARSYSDRLVSGSRGLPESLANELEPYDLGPAVRYAPSLTAGWVAERPALGHAEAARTVAREVAAAENAAIRDFVPGQGSSVHNDTELSLSAVRLALLPVWIVPVIHGRTRTRLFVNGQTGEVAGEVPDAWWWRHVRVAAVLLALLPIVAALVAAILLLGVALR